MHYLENTSTQLVETTRGEHSFHIFFQLGYAVFALKFMLIFNANEIDHEIRL